MTFSLLALAATASALRHAGLPTGATSMAAASRVRTTAPAFMLSDEQRATPAKMVATAPELASAAAGELPLPGLSGLNGKAMAVEMEDIPSKSDVKKAVPAKCFTRDTVRSLKYAAMSVAEGAACLALGMLIPMKMAFLPAWILYAAVTGTVWTGMWVIAHECGHGAFSDNRKIQDGVGYLLHSLLLVPYFSWQHSHAVHHANTNHITKGETHVPYVVDGRQGIELVGGEKMLAAGRALGTKINGALQLVFHLAFGWPAYLLFGATGGPQYGVSNHFLPVKPFSTKLWPGNWPKKVFQSDIGIVAMLGFLGACAAKFGLMSVLALYGGPLLFTNMWLVGYTWLQHTDVDVPHLSKEQFSYMRGAFLTIDRPYGPLLDHLHHKIGSTHVAHHIDCTIPHYYAREATDAIETAFPKAYLYDPTPIHKALWRVASNCIAVKFRPRDGRYTWVPL